MSTTYEPFRFQDLLTGRLLDYYGERWPAVVEAATQSLLAISRYLDWRDFGHLLAAAAEALTEPDRYRLGAEWFRARLEQGMHARLDGSYGPVARMAVRSLATLETALGDDFRIFLHHVADAHRTCERYLGAPATSPPG